MKFENSTKSQKICLYKKDGGKYPNSFSIKKGHIFMEGSESEYVCHLSHAYFCVCLYTLKEGASVNNFHDLTYSGCKLRLYIIFGLIIMTSKHFWLFQSI